MSAPSVAGQTRQNPLHEGLDSQRRPDPCILVIFGASGDLTQRKLIPSLFNLREQGLLPGNFAVLGISRSPLSDEAFREKVQPEGTSGEEWADFAEGLFYMSGNHGEGSCYESLAEKLAVIREKRRLPANYLHYLAVSPDAFPTIVNELGAKNLHRSEGWVRVILEKPFGTSLETARRLNHEIHGTFEENQVFRIDHYLGKESVQNILTFRFANGIFEPLWNRRYIDHIQITASESLGVGSRAGYYDHSGALRDMIQNHLMQLLCLTAMESPISFSDEAVRNEKAKVLSALRIYSPEEVDANVVRGQYTTGFVDGQEVPGYRSAPGVDPASRTETYAACRFFIDNWRWQGVPFYLRSGKCLPKKLTEIAIVFKPAPIDLFNRKVNTMTPNILTMRADPDEGITLRLASKIPGMTTRTRWVNMDFDYGSAFGTPSPTAYQRLLHDCMIGDATLYSRADAIEYAWEVTQPILDRWAVSDSEVAFYEAGSWGPEEADRLIEDDGRHWIKV
jgi:glucose-6-phosphate 1-dehydrogenase